jgi:predicted nicotinamide N-methyase
MILPGHCLPPSSNLPPVRSLLTAPASTITLALHNLQTLYCPLRLPLSLAKTRAAALAQVDSGYASRDEFEDAVEADDALAVLRADEFERAFAVRWLTGLIGKSDELNIEDEMEKEKIIDDAAFILSSFSDNTAEDADESLTRDFSFPTSEITGTHVINVRLNDAPLSDTDHTDVGLQSWGASIVISGLLCADPARFELDQLPEDASIIELGAGTGLVSLSLAKLLPILSQSEIKVLATDYHPTVLENLQDNIKTNFPSIDHGLLPVETMLLDWSIPPASLASSFHMLFAADVVYAPEHAIWLRDCAAHLLTPSGIFWLIVTVRKVGKFEGIPDTAEAAFLDEAELPQREGKKLRIVEKGELEKKRGIGRGDENGYMLFKITWV